MNILVFVEVKFVLNKTQALYKILYLNEFLLVVFYMQSKMCGNISKPRFYAWCGFVPRIFCCGAAFVSEASSQLRRVQKSKTTSLLILRSKICMSEAVTRSVMRCTPARSAAKRHIASPSRGRLVGATLAVARQKFIYGGRKNEKTNFDCLSRIDNAPVRTAYRKRRKRGRFGV